MHLVDRRTYRAKKPCEVDGRVDDRTIMYIASLGGFVLWEGPANRRKIGYTLSTTKNFMKWASHDVTQQLPAGCYQTWEHYLNQKLGIG